MMMTIKASFTASFPRTRESISGQPTPSTRKIIKMDSRVRGNDVVVVAKPHITAASSLRKA